jgi:hypothetical protein
MDAVEKNRDRTQRLKGTPPVPLKPLSKEDGDEHALTQTGLFFADPLDLLLPDNQSHMFASSSPCHVTGKRAVP